MLTTNDFIEARKTWKYIRDQGISDLKRLTLEGGIYSFKNKKLGFFWPQSKNRITTNRDQTLLNLNYGSHRDKSKQNAYEPSIQKVNLTSQLLKSYLSRYIAFQGAGYSPTLIKLLRKFGNVIFIPQMLRENGIAGMISVVPGDCNDVWIYTDPTLTFALDRETGEKMESPNLIYPAIGVKLTNEPFSYFWNIYTNPFSVEAQRANF